MYRRVEFIYFLFGEDLKDEEKSRVVGEFIKLRKFILYYWLLNKL